MYPVTVSQYLSAICNALSENQIRVLNTLLQFKDSAATAQEIAKILSPHSPSPIVASGQIGKIGKKISEYLSVRPEKYFNGRTDVPAFFQLVGPYSEIDGWVMNRNLKKALLEYNRISVKKSYLFVWNPKRFKWNQFPKILERVISEGSYTLRWSCGNSRNIQPGARVFLLKLGTEPKGIIGAGFAVSTVRSGKKWDGSGKTGNYIKIKINTLLNPSTEKIFSPGALRGGCFSGQNWTPQGSGVLVRPEFVDKLEAAWLKFLNGRISFDNPFASKDIENPMTYTEGSPRSVVLTKFERNQNARKKCIEYYGTSCVICGFNFEKMYGPAGRDFIHVHHLKKIADSRKVREVDPIKDLRPVCPNCHSIIHKNNIALTLAQMGRLLRIKK